MSLTRKHFDFWSFVVAMLAAYGLTLAMLLAAVGALKVRIDLLAIWQVGALAIALASAADGWLSDRKNR